MFPAPAGMNRRSSENTSSELHVPRTRGDEPEFCGYSRKKWVMFPAPAGMNRNSADIRARNG